MLAFFRSYCSSDRLRLAAKATRVATALWRAAFGCMGCREIGSSKRRKMARLRSTSESSDIAHPGSKVKEESPLGQFEDALGGLDGAAR
jgi:hypothetical protein